jgi:hypothetical protein
MTTHNKLIKISTTLPAEIVEKLETIASQEGMTIQELILSQIKSAYFDDSFFSKVSDTEAENDVSSCCSSIESQVEV